MYIRSTYSRAKNVTQKQWVRIIAIFIFHVISLASPTFAWSDKPVSGAWTRFRLAMGTGGILDVKDPSIPAFLVDRGWVDIVAFGDDGQKIIDEMSGGTKFQDTIRGFYMPRVKMRTIFRSSVEPSLLVVGKNRPRISRMHELSHLWVENTRRALNLPPISGDLEEVLVLGSHLSNPRRRIHMTREAIDNQKLYMSESLDLVTDEEFRRIPELFSRYTRRYEKLLSESTDLGEIYIPRLQALRKLDAMVEQDVNAIAGIKMRVAGRAMENSLAVMNAIEAASIMLDFSGAQVSNLGTRYDHPGLVVTGAFVSNLGHALVPGLQTPMMVPLEEALDRATISSPQAKQAGRVLLRNDSTLAGHMHSEAEMNARVGYHPGWCRYSCSPGCPNSYTRPVAPVRIWHSIMGGPSLGGPWDKRKICAY